MKNLFVLGSTGSIGRQTLEIVKENPGEFTVVSLACGSNIELLIEQIKTFKPKVVAVESEADHLKLHELFPELIIGHGNQGLVKAATYGPNSPEPLVVNALVGILGLIPTIHAIEAGRNVALANKESLVAGGNIIKRLLSEEKTKLFPIDSEHSGLWQLLQGEDPKSVQKVYLTASGGSFRHYERSELVHVTKEEALRHPNWEMGAKITVDSATMMNKGFEIIEAMHLFDLPLEKVETILHEESLVHAMVEFADGSIKAQLSSHDMRLPISYALFYPERRPTPVPRLDFASLGKIGFAKLDHERYPLMKVVLRAIRTGGSAPCAVNAANEAAVNLFLQGKIGFLDIEIIVSDALDHHLPIQNPGIADILNTDKNIKQSIYDRYLDKQGDRP
ncbi:MAG: 1-deoxy-D-xylulose-5-phosphate reductoisomerase [Candidatus Izemoplasmatales bacterium]|jgi:1-deoxy-D-xylulose-5-phosphate reductoisomerase